MYLLLHGENIVESRKSLTSKIEEAKAKGLEVINLGQKLTLESLRNSLESSSLFGSDRFIVIENFFSSTKSKEKTKIIDYLKNTTSENDVIFWEGKEISLPFTKIEATVFKVDQFIFKFLESLRPGNNQDLLRLLQQVKKTEESEMIFHMLTRQIRLLLMAKSEDPEVLGEMPSWQKGKIVSQSKYFTETQLKIFYKELLEIDYQQKTGIDPFNLTSRLDLLISKL